MLRVETGLLYPSTRDRLHQPLNSRPTTSINTRSTAPELRQSYIIAVPGVGQGVARGDFINYEYEIRGRDSDRVLATITRRFVSLRNAYDIEIRQLTRDQRIEDDVLFVATAAAIDLLENTDGQPDPPVAERPPAAPPAPPVICRGTITGSDLSFEAVSAPEGGFSSINLFVMSFR